MLELKEIQFEDEILDIMELLDKWDEETEDDDEEEFKYEVMKKKEKLIEKYGERGAKFILEKAIEVYRKVREVKPLEHHDHPEIEKPKKPEKPRVETQTYDNGIWFNDQFTYNRTLIDSDNIDSVYGLTLRSGLDVKMEFSPEFGGLYVKELDGMKDGENNKFLEYWVIDGNTGEKRIGEEAIDRQILKPHEFIEWRQANEQDSGCGGGVQDYDRFVIDFVKDKLFERHLRGLKQYGGW